MNIQREVAEKLWPQHAEICSEQDWDVLSRAVADEVEPKELVLTPHGEAKDEILASLMILYWTMKIVQLALEIKKSLVGVKPADRHAAILSAVNARVTDSTPRLVYNRIREIIDAINT